MSISPVLAKHATSAATAYTVIPKTGQRGTEYDDPGLAAEAFFHARSEDRPFVLRHRGAATSVIAVVKAGKKQITSECTGDECFRMAIEAYAFEEGPSP